MLINYTVGIFFMLSLQYAILSFGLGKRNPYSAFKVLHRHHRCFSLTSFNAASSKETIDGVSTFVDERPYKYVARVLYDGTDFHGWQDQGIKSRRRTVQATISKNLSKLFGNRQVTAVGAGRTDQVTTVA